MRRYESEFKPSHLPAKRARDPVNKGVIPASQAHGEAQ